MLHALLRRQAKQNGAEFVVPLYTTERDSVGCFTCMVRVNDDHTFVGRSCETREQAEDSAAEIAAGTLFP
jgi:hypothetical protein